MATFAERMAAFADSFKTNTLFQRSFYKTRAAVWAAAVLDIEETAENTKTEQSAPTNSTATTPVDKKTEIGPVARFFQVALALLISIPVEIINFFTAIAAFFQGPSIISTAKTSPAEENNADNKKLKTPVTNPTPAPKPAPVSTPVPPANPLPSDLPAPTKKNGPTNDKNDDNDSINDIASGHDNHNNNNSDDEHNGTDNSAANETPSTPPVPTPPLEFPPAPPIPPDAPPAPPAPPARPEPEPAAAPKPAAISKKPSHPARAPSGLLEQIRNRLKESERYTPNYINPIPQNAEQAISDFVDELFPSSFNADGLKIIESKIAENKAKTQQTNAAEDLDAFMRNAMLHQRMRQLNSSDDEEESDDDWGEENDNSQATATQTTVEETYREAFLGELLNNAGPLLELNLQTIQAFLASLKNLLEKNEQGTDIGTKGNRTEWRKNVRTAIQTYLETHKATNNVTPFVPAATALRGAPASAQSKAAAQQSAQKPSSPTP